MSAILVDIPNEAKHAQAQEYPNIYTPIPPNGKQCPFTGLKHAQLYKLLTHRGLAKDFVRVANIKEPGASKGKSVFHAGDMLRFIDSIARKQGTGTRRQEILNKLEV